VAAAVLTAGPARVGPRGTLAHAMANAMADAMADAMAQGWHKQHSVCLE
jgi:hypothetical protein